MKKGIIIVAGAFLMFATSCKETLAPNTITVDTAATESTTTGPIEPAQDRNVYIEEFTGVTCSNCPQGALQIEGIMEAHPNRVISLSFHTGNSNTAPIEQSRQDFRTADGTIMVSSIWQVLGGSVETKPNATFDRTVLSGNPDIMMGAYTGWPGAYASDLAKYPTTPVNLALNSHLNSETGRYEITVTVKYTSDVTYAHALNIYLSEDSIVDAQWLSPVDIINDYTFMHVFRKAITPAATGHIILPDMPTKQAGLVYTYKTSFAINTSDEKQSKWNPDHMKVTACVSVDNIPTDGHVMHVVQTALKGQ